MLCVTRCVLCVAGPDLYQRDYGGMGGDYIPVDYDPDLAVKFPQYATVDSVNFEEVCFVSWLYGFIK